jgi:hypothetical protein
MKVYLTTKMKDLTLIFLTANKVPIRWAEYHKSKLLEAKGDYPLIIVSKQPMDWGELNIIDEELPRCSNYYLQIKNACEMATTPYVAIVEDDVLYHKSHFTVHRPKLDTFAYNVNRWNLVTWWPKPAKYVSRVAAFGGGSINPRLEMISSVVDKFNKYPGGFDYYSMGEPGLGGEKQHKTTARKSESFISEYPLVQFHHDRFSNSKNETMRDRQERRKKRFGSTITSSIPYWGEAEQLIKEFK